MNLESSKKKKKKKKPQSHNGHTENQTRRDLHCNCSDLSKWQDGNQASVYGKIFTTCQPSHYVHAFVLH